MSFHTSPSDCSKRAHRIKKLHGMLPTFTVMKQRNPDLYDDDSCRRCYEQYPTSETEEHMWDCPESMETQRIGWEKAIEMVNHDGNRMVNKQEKVWELRKKTAEQNNKPYTTPRPTFTSLPAKDIKDSLLWIAGARDRIQSETDSDDDSDEYDMFDPTNDWHAHDLYRGLVPMLLTTIWAGMFATSHSTARYMVARFVQAIEEYMRKWIWNSRCELTVDWEKLEGITTVSKRARGRTSVGDHSGSSGDFSDLSLRQGLAVDVKVTNAAADERVIGNFHGKNTLNVIERLGRLQSLFLIDDSD